MRKRMPAIFIVAIIFIAFVGISSRLSTNKNSFEKKTDKTIIESTYTKEHADEEDDLGKQEVVAQSDEELAQGIQEEVIAAESKKIMQEDMSDQAIAADNTKDTSIKGRSVLVEETSIDNTDSSERKKYIARLGNLEDYYSAVWTDSCPPDMTGMKQLKNEEYTKWDLELNTIYQKIKADFTEADFLIIRDAEREWIKERDEKAAKAASEFAGGTMEGLEYMSVMTELTKQRTYELVEIYFDYNLAVID